MRGHLDAINCRLPTARHLDSNWQLRWSKTNLRFSVWQIWHKLMILEYTYWYWAVLTEMLQNFWNSHPRDFMSRIDLVLGGRPICNIRQCNVCKICVICVNILRRWHLPPFSLGSKQRCWGGACLHISKYMQNVFKCFKCKIKCLNVLPTTCKNIVALAQCQRLF